MQRRGKKVSEERKLVFPCAMLGSTGGNLTNSVTLGRVSFLDRWLNPLIGFCLFLSSLLFFSFPHGP